MKQYKIGYTTGVYDMFHIGHLNLLKRCKDYCDYLVVGVSTDELVFSYKNKTTVIGFEDRKEIVSAIRYVDAVVPQTDMDKVSAMKRIGAEVLFVGSDWQGTDKWNAIEKDLKEIGADVVYFPYTAGVSSTILREVKEKRID